jgi:hypothetical protein
MGWRLRYFVRTLKHLRRAVPQSPFQGINLRMPGRSHEGPLPPFTPEEFRLGLELKADVLMLAEKIGERNVHKPEAYRAAEDYIASELESAGYQVRRQRYDVEGVSCANLDAELPGASTPGEIVLVGAHYDSLLGTVGANDNASGVAATMALARRFARRPRARTIRFAFFANEEPPYYWTEQMGSLVYAKACKERGENIIAMLTPETIGYYSDEAGSQQYPLPAAALGYPRAGNFIMFVGMYESRRMVQRAVGVFRERCPFPSEGAAVSIVVPWVGASDHWSFWKQGYPAVMLTDTAPLRYPHYHRTTDTPDKIDYEKTARVVLGMAAIGEEFAERGI